MLNAQLNAFTASNVVLLLFCLLMFFLPVSILSMALGIAQLQKSPKASQQLEANASEDTNGAVESYYYSFQPICEASEACGIFFGRVMPLPCRCSNDRQCSAENRLTDNRNMKPYIMCDQPSVIPVCAVGDIALELVGYRHQIRCQCPEELRLVSLSWDPITDTSLYYCTKFRDCSEPGEVCMVRMKVLTPRVVSNMRTLCGCPSGQNCSNQATFANRTMEINEYSCE